MRPFCARSVFICVALTGVSLGGVGRGFASECKEGLCLSTPDKSAKSIDAELIGDTVEIKGKFATPAHLRSLVDFTISWDFTGIGSDPFSLPTGLFVPELEKMKEGGEFAATVPLPLSGPYDLSVQARILADDGRFQDVTLNRKVLRLSLPHLTVRGIKAGGSDLAGDTCKGGACSFGVKEGAKGATEPHKVSVIPPSATRIETVDLCVNSHGDDVAGSSIVILARNEIIDRQVIPPRTATITSWCGTSDKPCEQSPSTDKFCPGGFVVPQIPVGHGSNQINLYVGNPMTTYSSVWHALGDMILARGGGSTEVLQTIRVEPFDIDLKGPDLCVRYLDPAGTEIKDVDGKVLLSKEAKEVTVDVTLGRCGEKPEAVKGPLFFPGCEKIPPPCGVSPVCIQRNNEKEQVVMCPTDMEGTTHYRVRFGDLRFPLNTLRVTAKDELNNQRTEVHAFGYGDVRPLFDEKGDFNLKGAMIPKGVAGFVPADFITGRLKDVLLKILDSDKFKKDLFLNLLDPHQPEKAEIECLKDLESKLNCTFDHLASDKRVVAIKMLKGGGDGYKINKISIPSLYVLNDNKIRIQLKIEGWHGRAEMYTIKFIDSDGDGVVDTEDEDADNDGICDRFVSHVGKCTLVTHPKGYKVCNEVVGLSGTRYKGLKKDTLECHLDKDIDPAKCPDFKPGDKNYWGCSDQLNNLNGLSKQIDPKGRLIEDPDYGDPDDEKADDGVKIIPVRFAIKELAVNVDVTLKKVGDRLHVDITNSPGRALVDWWADKDYPIEFDCGKGISEIFQGGAEKTDKDVGNYLYINTRACKDLEHLNDLIAAKAGKKERKQQGTPAQLVCTFNATLRCSVPRRLEAALERMENDKTTATAIKVFDDNFHLDLYAPLGSSDVAIDSTGVGFAAKGLLIPAGTSDAKDTLERNGVDFLKNLPKEFKTSKFGPLSRDGDGKGVDPVIAASTMAGDINLALNEETINSILHSVTLLLWDLADKKGDAHQLADLDTVRIRKDFDMGIAERGDPLCKDKTGKPLKEGGTKGEDTWKCFPFVLDMQQVLGDLKYVDFDGNGTPNSEQDGKAPLLIRIGVNPFAPPVVRIGNVTILDGWGKDGPTGPAEVMAEIELGLGPTTMSIFEEQVENWKAPIVRGTGEIKDWCDKDRFPGMNEAQCKEGKRLPIATFQTSGKVSLTLLLNIREDGIIRLEAGLSGHEKVEGGKTSVVLDQDKTYLNLSLLENNTILPDDKLIAAFQVNITTILNSYVFGTRRAITATIPTQLPLKVFCDSYAKDLPEVCDCVSGKKKDGCDNISALEDLWEGFRPGDFGLHGITVKRSLLGATDDSVGPRYLTIGAGLDFALTPYMLKTEFYSAPLYHELIYTGVEKEKSTIEESSWYYKGDEEKP